MLSDKCFQVREKNSFNNSLFRIYR